VALSGLWASSTVAEAEINPLIVRRSGAGVMAVDALISAIDRAGGAAAGNGTERKGREA
jgi:hypothetical protein